MHKEMHPDTHRDLTQRLIDEFKFKDKSRSTLRQGRCPSCGEKELWAYASAPWVLMCGRTNNCNHQIHVRDHYPDLFENWEKRFKPTDTNPNATADAYLSEGRGFPLSKLKGLYSQEYYKNAELGVGSSTVRFAINDDPNDIGWWQRIIDDQGVLQKTTFQYKWSSAGHAWIPPNQNLIESAEIWITEGIFDSIALWLSGITTFTQLSAHNYPAIILNKIGNECDEKGIKRPKLVFALTMTTQDIKAHSRISNVPKPTAGHAPLHSHHTHAKRPTGTTYINKVALASMTLKLTNTTAHCSLQSVQWTRHY